MSYLLHSLGRTFYKSKGSLRKETPLIALHGGPGGMSLGLEPLLSLSGHRKVFIYDQIGGGRSSKIPKKKWAINTFIKEIDILIDHWGISSFHLFGASWGTTLALEYFLKRKSNGKIKSLIFQSPMFSTKKWEQDAKRLISKLPKKTQKIISYCHEIGATDSKVYKKAVFDYYLKHVLRDQLKLEKKSTFKNEHGHQIYEHMWGPSEFRAIGSLKQYDKTSRLKEINIPSLFICGEHDEATPETTKYFSKQVKESQFKIIKNSSHSILSERPRAILKEIDSFLKEQ